MAAAARSGIGAEDAQRLVVLAALRRGAALERLAEDDLKRRTSAALGEGYLDGTERALLLEQGTKLLGGGRAGAEKAERLLDQWVRAAGAVTEAELRADIQSRLVGTSTLEHAQWSELRRTVEADLRSRGVARAGLQDGDVALLFTQALADCGVAVRWREAYQPRQGRP